VIADSLSHVGATLANVAAGTL